MRALRSAGRTTLFAGPRLPSARTATSRRFRTARARAAASIKAATSSKPPQNRFQFINKHDNLKPMVTIAVDAMGGDKAPGPEIEGALRAAREYGHRVLLVGAKAALEHELGKHSGARNLPVEILHAPERITMDDHAAKAARTKRESSMHICARAVASSQADGFVSAGNTGACMAIAKMVLGKLPGVDRPALSGVF